MDRARAPYSYVPKLFSILKIGGPFICIYVKALIICHLSDGTCLNRLKVCDGYYDCADNSDEINCKPNTRQHSRSQVSNKKLFIVSIKNIVIHGLALVIFCSHYKLLLTLTARVVVDTKLSKSLIEFET